MKITLILIFLSLAIVLVACAGKSKQIDEAPASNTPVEDTSNPYTGLRNMALSATAEQLELPGLAVYGIIMDISIGKDVATIVSFASGDASMYTSTGGGMIGGAQHNKVNEAAKAFVATASTFAAKATATTDTRIPAEGEVTFYILTKDGKKAIVESLTNLENEKSSYQALWNAGQDVLTELRLSQEAGK